MNKSFPFSIKTVNTKTKHWLIIVVAVSILVLGSIMWLFFEQKSILKEERLILEHIRLARIDLSTGFLNIGLGSEQDDSFRNEVGLVYINQSINSLRKIINSDDHLVFKSLLKSEKKLIDIFDNNVTSFHQNIALWNQDSTKNPELEFQLRTTYKTIVENANQIDIIVKQNLNRLSSKLDLQFVVAIFISCLLLLFICFRLFKSILDNENTNKALLDSELKMKSIADNLVNGMLYQVVMIDENKRQLNYVSEAVNKFYGCSVQEALQNPDLIYDNIHPDDIPNLIEKKKEALTKMAVFETEARVFNTDGSIRWVNYVSKPRIINDIVCWDGIEIDITERKQLENDLIKAKEKAEENDRLKNAFLMNMSHEIRTPMNAILGFSDLLMKKDITNDKKKKYHDIINKSGNRLMNIISDIVDISKIDANELILRPVVFNLNKMIDGLYHQFSILSKNNNTNITAFKELNDAESFIKCDETRLTQILSNLLENAIKFTHNGTIEFGYKLDENIFHFYVKDSGVGINAKDHQHIFERFGQSDNEILKAKEGTGLGLAICKGLVKLFGGDIWVESEPYKGATFHFTNPNCVLSHQEKGNDEKSNGIIIRNTTKTILIAEDEETNYWFLEAALDGHPFNLIHVENGKEAVETMKADNNIDLILMDFNMPIMNGIDATKEIRKTNVTIPIIALTAYAMMADKENALAIGCTDYLSKPVSKDILLETINRALS